MSVVDDNEKAVDPPVESGVEDIAGTAPNAVTDFQQSAKNEKKLFREHLHLNSLSGSEFFGQIMNLFMALISGLTKGNFERFEFLKMAYGFGEAPDGSMYNENWKRQPGYAAANKAVDGMNNIANNAKTAYRTGDTEKIAQYQEIGGTYMEKMRHLLDFIGKAEGAGYNTIFSGAWKRFGKDHNLTDMTISQIYDMQKRMIASGTHSPMGKYQFNHATLKDYVGKLGLDPNTTKFTPEIQRQLAITRFYDQISRSPGVAQQKLAAFFNGATEHKNTIQNALAGVWASIPEVSGLSAYHGIAGNKATGPGKQVVPLLDMLSRPNS